MQESHRLSASKNCSSSPYSKRSRYAKLPVVLPSRASKTSLEPQTPPPYRNPDQHSPISGELKFSRTCLNTLESLLMISPHPAPKMKEALHQIKKDLKFSETFHSDSLTETSSKPSGT